MIAEITAFEGRIVTHPSKLDGTSRKLMDVSRLSGTGWRAKIDLPKGITQTYQWFLQNQERFRS